MYVHRLCLIKLFLCKLDLNTVSYIWITDLSSVIAFTVSEKQTQHCEGWETSPHATLYPHGALIAQCHPTNSWFWHHPLTSPSTLCSTPNVATYSTVHLQRHQTNADCFICTWLGKTAELCSIWSAGTGELGEGGEGWKNLDQFKADQGCQIWSVEATWKCIHAESLQDIRATNSALV